MSSLPFFIKKLLPYIAFINLEFTMAETRNYFFIVNNILLSNFLSTKGLNYFFIIVIYAINYWQFRR